MGVPFFSTLIDDFLFAKKNPSKLVNLTNQRVIIDGYSFFYFIYDQTRHEDQSKSIAQRVTATQFGYDGLWEKLRNSLKQFKEKCADVIVVFDGVSKPNKYRRPDPERASSVKFNDDGCGLPSLLRDELLLILHNLQIKVHVSPGEADPMIVHMARKHDAYIVARDSDYFLYEVAKGYVPLSKLIMSTLEGQYYHMTDVFQRMTQRSVALWVTTIAFEFIKLKVLQDQFSTIKANDKKQFDRWLMNSDSDDEKQQLLTCQYSLLRYIQDVGEVEACKKLYELVLENKSEFDQIMQSYINISIETSILTKTDNEIPKFLKKLYTIGKLDRAIIDILVNREVLHYWQGTNLVHFNLLLPMCHILIKWDYSTAKDTIHPCTVTFNGQTYNPLELVESSDLPLLTEFDNLDEGKRKGFVLGCVNFALQLQHPMKWDGVHRDYKLWLSLLKLWLHSKKTNEVVSEFTLLAMIISFLKHVLLDTYDETEERSPRSETLPEKPYLQYSQRKLKKYFTRETCSQLRQSIETNTVIILSNEDITRELQECQQFYKELSMINQFSGQPFDMPPPRLCFSQLTYRLAVTLSQSKNMWKDIKIFCQHNELFIEFVEELHAFSIKSF